MTPDATRKIEARQRGNALGFWFFRVSLRAFGLRGAYGLLYIVCSYYVIFDRRAVQAARAYVDRRFPDHGRWARLTDVYRLFVSQGKNLIDRYYLISGVGRFGTRVEGEARLRDVMQGGHGIVLLTAHVGNWQTIMNYLGAFERKVNLVMRPEDNPAVRESLGIDRSGQVIGIISPEGYLGGVVESMNALGRGEVVSLMGDRSYGFNPVEVNFLGGRAWFASGAFHLAAMAGCPAVVLLSAKTGTHDYTVEVVSITHPRYQPGIPKREQLAGWVQAFAQVLEEYLIRHPYQCFLFYDIWQKPEMKHRPLET